MEKTITSDKDMASWGKKLGNLLIAGDIIELVGDVGVGKTTLAKGIMAGAGVKESVSSPSFTISRNYVGHNGLNLRHYDFYRLEQAGVILDQIQEEFDQADGVAILEWANTIKSTLPIDRLTINITFIDESSRLLVTSAGGDISSELLGRISQI